MKFFFSVILIFLATILQGQSCENLQIANDAFKFRVRRTTIQFYDKNNVTPSKNLIRTDINDSMRMCIKKIDYNEWLTLLLNEKSDWTANLLLYELYQKDATKFKVIQNRDDWINSYKKEDVEYWTAVLSDKLSK